MNERTVNVQLKGLDIISPHEDILEELPLEIYNYIVNPPRIALSNNANLLITYTFLADGYLLLVKMQTSPFSLCPRHTAQQAERVCNNSSSYNYISKWFDGSKMFELLQS
jgi:hypothetical protein